jgi:hypothetical protein
MLDDATRAALERSLALARQQVATLEAVLGVTPSEDPDDVALTLKQAEEEFGFCNRTARSYAMDPALGFFDDAVRPKGWRIWRGRMRAFLLNRKSRKRP